MHTTQSAAPATASACPECGGAMRTRQGSRGQFLGCKNYPTCRGSRSIENASSAPGSQASLSAPRVEAPTPSGALITDLRAAAGHIGRAVDLLRRRQVEVDELIDQNNGISF